MVLRIEKPETIQLVTELERRTGHSAERIIEDALRGHLARLRTPEEEAARRAEIYGLVEELRAMFREAPDLITDHGELLYGEDGLPK